MNFICIFPTLIKQDKSIYKFSFLSLRSPLPLSQFNLLQYYHPTIVSFYSYHSTVIFLLLHFLFPVVQAPPSYSPSLNLSLFLHPPPVAYTLAMTPSSVCTSVVPLLHSTKPPSHLTQAHPTPPQQQQQQQHQEPAGDNNIWTPLRDGVKRENKAALASWSGCRG